MKTRLWQSVVSVACCISLTGCTVTRTLSDPPVESVPEASATSVRPFIKIIQDPFKNDNPALIVELSKRLEGPIELQTRTREVVQTIWGQEPMVVGFGWLGVVLSPLVPIAEIGAVIGGGKDSGKGLKFVGTSFLVALGFNTPKGWDFHTSDREVSQKVETSLSGKSGIGEIPLANGSILVTAEGKQSLTFYSDWKGEATVDLNKLPVDLAHPIKDLKLSLSASSGGATVEEHITVTVATMLAWQERKAKYVQLEQERKAQLQRELEAKREREAQAAREAAAKAEYERQHPEIAAARQAQAAAEQQCTNCKSSCDTQALACTTACFGNLSDLMCSTRCLANQESCKGGCEQRRDAQIAQAGGTPIGSSSSSGFMQGLVAVADGMAAAKGISPAGTVGRPSSSQTGLAGVTQALSAMAGGNVVPPGGSAPSGFTAPGGGSPVAGGNAAALAGGQCDDSAEAREVDAMTKRAAVETKGMGIERLQCYMAQQYVRIAELQVRAATRCNVLVAESQAELQNLQAQSRKQCQGIR